jgi:hypothetical protein
MFKDYVMTWLLEETDLLIEDLLYPHFKGEKNGPRNAIVISEYLFMFWIKRRQIIFDRMV